MKTKYITIIGLAALFSSCASFQNAQQASDYNCDGVVSDAEYRQFNKQKSVEAGNVQVERMKRENAVDTVRDANDALWNVHGVRNAIRAF
jgi:hypothetical protein